MMEPSSPDPKNPQSQGHPPRRRPRYAGTHPRQFEHRYKELNPQAYPNMHEHVRERGNTPAGTHVPILLKEVIEALNPAPGDVVADCTIGFGGHAAELMRRIGPTGRLIGFDVDAVELERTRQRLEGLGVPLQLHHGNFAGLGRGLSAEGLDGYDIILADLGVSSMQIDNPARGFSYKHNGPLDMRMDPRRKRTAADLLATLSEEDLSAALQDLADEPDHALIARAIVERRSSEPIARTDDLVRLIVEVKGPPRSGRRDQASSGGKGLHPAALTFQALRMLVNDELSSLAQLLRTAPYCLRPGGRIGIISFHSGEDRMVKKGFRDGLAAGVYCDIAPEVVRPGPQERRDNPRSTSAKFRWARRSAMGPD